MPRKQAAKKPRERAKKNAAVRTKEKRPSFSDTEYDIEAGPFTGFDEIDPSIVDEDDTEDE